MEVRMELARIVINDTSEQQIIVLRERGGSRQFPIVIGVSEALAIDRRVKNIATPRPLTHDLLADVIRDLDNLVEMEVRVDGKGYVIRSESRGVVGKVAQAVGVALPPTLRPCAPPQSPR